MSVQPLTCIVCEKPITNHAQDWVRPWDQGPIYGLHQGRPCKNANISWDEAGRPIVKPTLEKRIAALEEKVKKLEQRRSFGQYGPRQIGPR